MLSATLLKPAVRLLSPGAANARLSILIYHRVLPQRDPMLSGDPDADTFRWQMQVVSRLFNVLPLSEAVTRLKAGTLPPRAACITFDDGYADNAEVALPILSELGLNATFFIATGYLNGGMMFNDKVIETLRRIPGEELDLSSLGLGPRPINSLADRSAVAMEIIRHIKHLDTHAREDKVNTLLSLNPEPLPADLMLSSEQLKRLADAGMGIGGHTVSHPILSQIPDQRARQEMGEGRETLEGMLQQPVTLFAYPNGKPNQDYAARHVDMARKSGFDAAVSTAWGVSTVARDRYQLARFTPWDHRPARFAVRLARNLLQTHATLVGDE